MTSEPETPSPFAGWTAAQCTEYLRKLAAERTPGQKARADAQRAVNKSLYTNLRQLIEATYELGKFAGPDGVKAREQKTEKARAREQTIFIAVKNYLMSNPQIKCRASLKGAADIQKAIEEILDDKVSLSKLFEALRKLRKECLARIGLAL